jgi:hypothetical protein
VADAVIEADAALVQQGMRSFFKKLSSDWRAVNPDGTVMTKSDVMQMLQGFEETLKLAGVTLKVDRVETALEWVMPQSDGTVVADVMRKHTHTVGSLGRPREEKIAYERVTDTWRKENGRWLIVRSETKQ